MARILIAGCGYVGTALGLELAARGDEVFGLRRDPSSLPPALRPLAGELTDPDSLTGRLPPALDAVVYAASAGEFSDEAYRRAYVEGPAALLEALERVGASPSRILFTSSIGVYGRDDGGRVDEETPPDASRFSGRRVLEGEECFRAGPWPSVSLRLGGIYGPGRSSLVDRVRSGEPCPGGTVWSNRIHRDDCAGALVHLLDLPDPLPVYVGVDREPAPLCDVMRWIAERIGVPAPEPAADGSGGGRGRNRRCSSDRLVESGYRFRFPTWREGFGLLLG